jgi:hypothetical protein
MDPNEALKELLELTHTELNGGVTTNTQVSTTLNRMAELVDGLDGWITKGGFLPDRWRLAQKAASAAAHTTE